LSYKIEDEIHWRRDCVARVVNTGIDVAMLGIRPSFNSRYELGHKSDNAVFGTRLNDVNF